MVATYVDSLTHYHPVRPLKPHETQSAEGGIVSKADDWTRLTRFLILGSDGGTFYVQAKELTLDNLDVVRRCLAADGERTVTTITEISVAGRAPKNDPAILALVLALRDPNLATRRAAEAAFPKVCRTGTHMLHAAKFVLATGGWGRLLRRTFGNWFLEKSADDLAYQAIKYPSRDGVSLADVLRLAHPKPKDGPTDAILKWIVDGNWGEGDKLKPYGHSMLVSRDYLHGRTGTGNALDERFYEEAELIRDAVSAIRAFRLPREALPTWLLNSKEVWEALLAEMPMTAMVRNLAKMTAVGLLTNDVTNGATHDVIARLSDRDRLRKARVHPIALLAALKVYEQGHGEKGSLKWIPVKRIANALDEAFYASFETVEPSGKKIRLALDVSGSMDGNKVNGMPFLTAREAAAAMALVTAATEPNYQLLAYSTQLRDITKAVRPSMRLDEVCRIMQRIPFGGTYCSLPIAEAVNSGTAIDAFVSYTDSETFDGAAGRGGYSGSVADVLGVYRQRVNADARHIVVAVTSNGFSIADPEDNLSLDVAGMDSSAPSVISDFIAGRM